MRLNKKGGGGGNFFFFFFLVFFLAVPEGFHTVGNNARIP